jgi:hypothetical protein
VVEDDDFILAEAQPAARKVGRLRRADVPEATEANPDAISRAFDDNELTGWKNDGRRATAWIQFDLERKANVSEVVLKLGGWRNKSYPLRVSVDGQEAWLGATPKSLGYVTLPLKPTVGKTVRLELVGAIDEQDGFGMVEVTGKKLETNSVNADAKGTLEIIEAEIYEPLAVASAKLKLHTNK